MNYRLPDEEYAVLNYIRSQKGVHIDHLKIIFGSVAVTAVDHLYQYGLINPDFPNEDIWHPSLLGKAYRHEKPEQSNIEDEKNGNDFSDDQTYIEPATRPPFYMSNLFWTIISVGVAVLFGILGIVFR